MMYNMYCDPLKNLVMFLPDGTSDADVLSLAAAAVPEFSDASIKQTGYIDLFHKHKNNNKVIISNIQKDVIYG